MLKKKKKTKKTTYHNPLPSKDEILNYINGSPNQVGKREIARAFKISAEDRPAFKLILKELEVAGSIEPKRHRRFSEPTRLPEVTILDAVRIDSGGELIAVPATWEGPEPSPIIFIHAKKLTGRAIGIGDRILARLSATADSNYQAYPIRRLIGGPQQILGLCEISDKGMCIIRPINRRERRLVTVPRDARSGAKHGELVLANVEGSSRKGSAKGRIVERLMDTGVERALSLLAIHSQKIPYQWPAEVVNEAKKCGPTTLGERVDLRSIPLVTIDGSDARDFDDAVWAEPDTDPDNPQGWHMIVAIADVAWYVHPKSALDRAAYERGNSTYFPDQVIPMLPEELSNGWCSLKPNEERPCLAVNMWINKEGKLLRQNFVRGLMRSAGRLTYEQAQAAYDGKTDEITRPLLDKVIQPLFKAYACLDQNRERRGALELNIPERKIAFNKDGMMSGILPQTRLSSHQLIEEFMVLANVAAARSLQQLKVPGLYRVHEPPEPERIDKLRKFLKGLNYNLAPTGNIRAADFNGILKAVEQEPTKELINMMILRAQSQARYEPENLGHFGLSLGQYTHFTSPIRRYSDLIVHRALITAFNLGKGGLGKSDACDLSEVTEHISMTERRSAAAERETIDRYAASLLSQEVGNVFTGKINGVSRFGLFVTLDESGADGIVPIKRLPRDYYDVFEDTHSLLGRNSEHNFTVGDPITLKLLEADPITGSIGFDFVDYKPLRTTNMVDTTGQKRKTLASPRGAKSFRKRRKRKL
ncbi:MAG: ribonuclease R [Rhodospirillaceae bacterium]